jgi:hypothetical protein
MKKALIAAGAIAAAVLLARRFAGRCGGIDVEHMIERMPDNAPPKWMFTNISAIRENTDRILERLESGPESGPSRTPTAAHAD